MYEILSVQFYANIYKDKEIRLSVHNDKEV